MMKIIQFQNRIQAFWWEGLPMVKTMGLPLCGLGSG
jgi:hypothetical protein